MTNLDVLRDAADDYAKAQDLAISIRNRTINLTDMELLRSRVIFKKWVAYFADLSKRAQNAQQRHNYQYLKNKFCNYYRALL